MIIVKVQGGLGNQMFQYSLYEWLLSNGKDVKLDISHYQMNTQTGAADTMHNGYELERIFSVNATYATFSEICKFGSVRKDIVSRAWRKFFGVKKTHITREKLGEKRWYFDELKTKDNVYLEGYWCSFKYADAIREKITNRFTFSSAIDENNENIIRTIKETNSVGLHIRHGDYLKLQDVYCSLDENYYQRAISMIKKNVENPVFFCFSDDIAWCREHIKEEQIYYIDWNHKEDSFRDMQLMSLCKHNILANSTFSMWGAWLNANPNKIVVRPQKVFVNPENEFLDFWPEDWLVLNN